MEATELIQMWNGSGWEDYQQFLYAYDSHQNLIAFEIQEWLGSWKSTFRYILNFDENNFLRYTVTRSFDESGIVYFGYSTHYYYRTITSIGDVLPGSGHVTISPNPANELITLASENEINGISVFSLLDKRIYTSEETGIYTTNEIDISTWLAGIYLVVVNEGDTFFTKKLVVQ